MQSVSIFSMQGRFNWRLLKKGGEFMFNNEELLENSSQIRSIRDFASFDNANKNVFVCLVGEDSTYIDDIRYMDKSLRRSVAYNRISVLPAIPPNKIAMYDGIYNNWLRDFKSKIILPSIQQNPEKQALLSDSLKTVIDIFSITKKHLSDSMEKNFSMKMLYWYDYAVQDLIGSVQYINGIYIVGENVTKIQEYLFYYMVALTGAHVLLLQNKADIDIPVIRLKLSSRVILGHLGNSVIPEFDLVHMNQSSSNRFVPPGLNRASNRNSGLSYNSPRAQRQPQHSGGITPATQYNNIPVQRQPQYNGGITSGAPYNNIPVQRQPQYSGGSASNTQYNSPVSRQPQPYGSNAVTQYNTPIQQRTQSGQSFRRAPEQHSTGNIKMKIPPRPDRHKNASQSAIPVNSSDSSVKVKLPPRAPSVYVPYDNGFGYNSQPDTPAEKTYEQIAKLAVSVVQIFAVQREYPNSDRVRILGSGSGIVISSMGHILTNHHVSKASREYMIRVENDDTPYFTNRLIKYHTDLDLAIIQIDKKLTPIHIYDGRKQLVRGQNVVAIGSPEGLFNTVSNGIISGFREIKGVDMIQFTAPISCGSSGGALLNMQGELIGISTAGLDAGQNINFAVDYQSIRNFTMGISGLM